MSLYRIGTKKESHALFVYQENSPLKILKSDKWIDTSFFLKPLEIE